MTITAEVIADSISSENRRLTTLQLKYPRMIHAEFMTHRQFSRNASSSRAIPVEKQITEIIRDTAMPIHWGANQKGMQADKECRELLEGQDQYSFRSNFQGMTATEGWLAARDRAIEVAQKFSDAGYHKQIVNRLLEPFAHINVVVSATEYSNFFALRCDPGAMPEMQELAYTMKEVMEVSEPRELQTGQWHLPYVDSTELKKIDIDAAIRCSAARCARVSYVTHEFKKPSLAEDLALYQRLVGSQPIHASPTEHQATPDELTENQYSDWEWKSPWLHGNFVGWKQHRKTLVGECI